MLVTAMLAATIATAGTYQTEGDVVPATIIDAGKNVTCIPLDKERAFSVDGPANAKLQLWIDATAG